MKKDDGLRKEELNLFSISFSGNFFKKVISFFIVLTIINTVLLTGLGFYLHSFITNHDDKQKINEIVYEKEVFVEPASLEKSVLTIPDIVEEVSPSVVGIFNRANVGKLLLDEMVDDGIGTGVIISKEGLVLTNYHVVEGANEIEVLLSNGKGITANIVNFDATMDLAVIKLNGEVGNLPVAKLGDSDKLRAGEIAIAIGNPLGKQFLRSVTIGVISATGREITIDGKKFNLIQTDAAINRGNSGGPLVNFKGEVVGITTVKITNEGVEGLGFAIPINEITPKIDVLSKPRLVHGLIGQDITEEIAAKYNIPTGFYITGVEPFSGAEMAGLRKGDIVLEFDNTRVETLKDIDNIKNKFNSGDMVDIKILRNTEILDTQIRLQAYHP